MMNYYYSMKRMVLTGAAATVIVAALASPALAEEAHVRDHRDDGGAANNVGVVADPVSDSGKDKQGIVTDPVKDPGEDNQGVVVDPVRDPAKNPTEGIVVGDPVNKAPVKDSNQGIIVE